MNSSTKPHLFLLGHTKLCGDEFTSSLISKGYQLQCFYQPESLNITQFQADPLALILEPDSSIACEQWLHKIIELKQLCGTTLLHIFIISTHMNTRMGLLGMKAGTVQFLPTSMNEQEITSAINHQLSLLNSNAISINKSEPKSRILYIDENVSQSTLFRQQFDLAGIQTELLNDPFEALEMLQKCQLSGNIDLILLCLDMKETSALDIADLLKTHTESLEVPLVFMSKENNYCCMLNKRNIDCDDYFALPAEVNCLAIRLKSRIKKSQQICTLEQKFTDSDIENINQKFALDKHAIVSITDIAGRITYVNEKFCNISGYENYELIGQNHRILNSGYHHATFFKNMWQTISSGQVWQGTICNKKKDGDQYWVESTIVPFLNSKGLPYQYVSIRTEVTSLIANEDRLRRSQAFANIGTWDWNLETGKIYWSERMGALFGLNKTVSEITHEEQMKYVHPDDYQLVRESITNCLEKNQEYDVEHRVVWTDGSIHWMHVKGDVIRNNDGKPSNFLGIQQNITEKKLAEQHLLSAKEEAEKANLAKSQFLSSMSHELRTPMNAIIGFAQLLQMDASSPPSPEQMDNIMEIVGASKHLLELINEVLNLSEIEAGKINLSIHRVTLSEVIIESLSLVYSLLRKNNNRIKLSKNGVPFEEKNLRKLDIDVRADHTRLKQVFLNLLTNAIKYNSKDSDVLIDISIAQTKLVRVSFSDKGKGINAKNQELLFQPFNRLGAEQSKIEGTGIGLVISRQIVELMAGNIGFTSEENKGSTFWFEVPINERRIKQRPSDLEENSLIDKNKDKFATHSKKQSILYIEDNPANLKLVTKVLCQRPNIQLWTAHNAEFGLELAELHCPDLIMLDINLPGMDGFRALKKLKKSSITCNTPVMALSANAKPEEIARALHAGFEGYITKPIDITSLLLEIENFLST